MNEIIWRIVAAGVDVKSKLPNTGEDAVDNVIQGIFNAAYGIAGVLAVIFLIVAGFQYITSSGDPGKTKRALNIIIYALVGLVIVLAAAAITNLIFDNIG